MSAPPSPFSRIRKPNSSITKAPAPSSRVTETDEVVYPPANEEIGNANLDGAAQKAPRAWSRSWPIYLWILASLATGLIAGRLLYVLWEHVASHDQQLARQRAAIEGLTETRTVVSGQAYHLKALDASTATIQAVLEAQAKKLADLEKAQAGMRDQLNGMDTRWQKQMNEVRRIRAAAATAPAPVKAENATAAKTTAAMPLPPAPDKHNETFSPDLKPTPNASAQMSANGLVVWMTPRPGFAKPVPTSVLGYVRGLGMLVHDWDDNKHYFITDSGSWLIDPR